MSGRKNLCAKNGRPLMVSGPLPVRDEMTMRFEEHTDE